MGLSTVIWRVKMMSSDTAVRIMAVKQLGAAGSFDALKKALYDSSRAVRVTAADGLSDLGDEGFAILAHALHHGTEVETRAVVAAEIGRSDHPAAVTELLKALRDPNDVVFDNVCRALESKHATEAIPSLHHILINGSVERRCRVMASLMAIPDVRSVRPLSDALDDSNSKVRSMAAKALGVFGNAQQVESMCRSDELSFAEDGDDAATDQIAARRYTNRLRIQRLHDFS